MTFTNEQQELWALVQHINTAWYKGNPSEIAACFHNDVIFNSPDFKHEIKGKENCVQTYTDFINSSKVLKYTESNPKVQLIGNTAIVTYDYEMKYEQNNKTYHESGTDILVFTKEQNSRKVIWRGMSNFKNL